MNLKKNLAKTQAKSKTSKIQKRPPLQVRCKSSCICLMEPDPPPHGQRGDGDCTASSFLKRRGLWGQEELSTHEMPVGIWSFVKCFVFCKKKNIVP